MQFRFTLHTGALLLTAAIAAPMAHAQDPTVQAQGEASVAVKGMPPRTAPSEYQAQAQAGNLTIAAEFMGHSIPTPDAIYMNDDYVCVEVAVFGPAGAHANMSIGDFSLRINGRKQVQTSQPYELAFHSLRDPEWEPPKAAQQSKTSIGGGGAGGGGGGGLGDPPPAAPKMPIDLRRTMELRVKKVTMAVGDRELPQAALIFFDYRGKVEKITSLELTYSSAAGTATLTLQR